MSPRPLSDRIEERRMVYVAIASSTVRVTARASSRSAEDVVCARTTFDISRENPTIAASGSTASYLLHAIPTQPIEDYGVRID